RFSRAVLTDQPDRARLDTERHIIQGTHRAVKMTDVIQLEETHRWNYAKSHTRGTALACRCPNYKLSECPARPFRRGGQPLERQKNQRAKNGCSRKQCAN